jgi:cytochrome bd-type quinol oxidase subunit 2
MTATGAKPTKLKMAMRFLIGALAGAAGTILFIELVGKPHLDFDDRGTMLALIAGLIYALLGLSVGLGALAPRQGAAFLNVEDADEIREQRGSLAPSAISCILIGAFLLLLAMAPGLEQAAGREIVVAAALICVAGIVAISFATRGRADELMRQVGLEASAFTLHVALAVLSVWALLAHLDYVSWVGPLELIAGLALLELCAIFYLGGKRGLMKPR